VSRERILGGRARLLWPAACRVRRGLPPPLLYKRRRTPVTWKRERVDILGEYFIMAIFRAPPCMGDDVYKCAWSCTLWSRDNPACCLEVRDHKDWQVASFQDGARPAWRPSAARGAYG
jgi:hypothetical protein